MTSLNEGTLDRAFRIVVGIVVGYVAVISWPGIVSSVAALFSAILIATGLIGWCPMYTAFHFSTTKKAA